MSPRAVLALPHARGLFAAGALARLPYGLHLLPLLLALRAAGGSYAVAGLAVGAYSLVGAVLGPARARLVERRPAALPWLAAGFAGLLGALALLAGLRAGPVTAVLAPVAGLLAPPVGPLVRVRLGGLARTDAERQATLSLDAVLESTVFALGPALAGASLTVLAAPVVLGLCAAWFALGFLALAAVFRGLPVPRAEGGCPSPAAPSATSRVPLRSAAFSSVLLAVFSVGTAGALTALAAVAAWGGGVAGALDALVSVGGVLGGLAYGRRSWRRPARHRLVWSTALGAAGLVLAALCFSPAGAAVGFLLVGAATDCVLITAYLLVEEVVPAGSRTEGGAWVNTAINLGSAAGSALGGLLLAAPAGARGVFVAGPLLLLAVLVPLTLRRPSRA
ncbi:MFS transporter [Streptacidiphilus pinicola]|uniref:MFS transporter n=1 Tax=Streptacidiphilus pinicola TaxID=2219663 RepID=A0A2X0IR64_9ACTN|nr:MFS transporter [Streptacidiphilus pinicola]